MSVTLEAARQLARASEDLLGAIRELTNGRGHVAEVEEVALRSAIDDFNAVGRDLDAQLNSMSKEERNLLLYLETAATDYGGLYSSVKVNAADVEILDRWNKSEFVHSGRIAFHDIPQMLGAKTNWCVLSEDAWALAQRERRLRSARLMDKLSVERLGLPT